MAVTLRPRDFNRRPMDEDVIPFPNPDITPPVTKINFICATGLGDWFEVIYGFVPGFQLAMLGPLMSLATSSARLLEHEGTWSENARATYHGVNIDGTEDRIGLGTDWPRCY